MDSEYESLKMYSDSTPLINIESKECFICREGDEMGRDGLLHFCDCKNLFAHQKCLLTWIQKSLHNENVPTCKVCTAEYQLEKKSPWRFLATQWHQWVVLCTVLVLMISTPFLVYQMIVAFKDPPPGLLFNVAAICVGALTEILLTKMAMDGLKTVVGFSQFAPLRQNRCLINYCTSNLEKARMSSFSIRARMA